MAFKLKLAGRDDTDKLWAHIFKDGKNVGSLTHSGGGLTKDPRVKLQLKGHPKDGQEIGQSDAESMFGKPEKGDWEMKESIEMSEDTRNEATVGSVINMIRQGNNLKAEEAFKVVMDQKVGAAIRAKTPEVAQSMFNNQKR